VDARGFLVGIDVESSDDRLVEGPASSFAGEPVELVGPFEQLKHSAQSGSAGVQISAVRLGDLVFGPVRIADQVEVLAISILRRCLRASGASADSVRNSQDLMAPERPDLDHERLVKTRDL
jgi:hypothetical protein